MVDRNSIGDQGKLLEIRPLAKLESPGFTDDSTVLVDEKITTREDGVETLLFTTKHNPLSQPLVASAGQGARRLTLNPLNTRIRCQRKEFRIEPKGIAIRYELGQTFYHHFDNSGIFYGPQCQR